ncbi:MAG: C_GCAxxG_C_C family protein [Solobacterium sp.]|nr:C_GCAxxG_C_C family protein [Solobacterium sp.]MBR3128711.1 C_GCAxxG_C_C family protein [Solobacterium sp.]
MNSELREKIYKQGMENEAKYGGCAQCVLLTLSQTALDIPAEVIKSATGLMAGGVRSGNSCGAFSGALMAISCVVGRPADRMDDKTYVAKTAEPGRKLYQKFMDEYGTVLCRDIQYKIMGKSYRMYDPEDMKRFLADGGHDDKCTAVVAKACIWVLEVLEECDIMHFE